MQLPNGTLGEFLGKAALLVTFGVLTALKIMAIRSQWMSWGQSEDVDNYLGLGAHIAQLAFLFLVLGTTLLRLRPQRTAEGLEPRLSALLGTFLSMSLVAFPPVDLGPLWRTTSIVLVLVGGGLSICVLASLGRSFSITPQARRLVTTGPYSFVRHPLYVSEEIAFIGIAMMCISPGTLIIVVVQWLFQLRRMGNEERVLKAAFPEYASYAARTPRIIPRLVWGGAQGSAAPQSDAGSEPFSRN